MILKKVMGIMLQLFISMLIQVQMDAWLDVVCHLKVVHLKCQHGFHCLLSQQLRGTLWWLENCKTMGSKITKVTSFEGVAAETAEH
jgi:hypothetical protein